MKFCEFAETLPDLQELSPIADQEPVEVAGSEGGLDAVGAAEDDEDLIPDGVGEDGDEGGLLPEKVAAGRDRAAETVDVESSSRDGEFALERRKGGDEVQEVTGSSFQAQVPARKVGGNQDAWNKARVHVQNAQNACSLALESLKDGWDQSEGLAQEISRLRGEVKLVRSAQLEKDRELGALRAKCAQIQAEKERALAEKGRVMEEAQALIDEKDESLIRAKNYAAEKDRENEKTMMELGSVREQLKKARQEAVSEYAASYRQKSRVDFFARAYYVLGGYVGVKQMAERHGVPLIKFDTTRTFGLRLSERRGYVPPALGEITRDCDETLEAWDVSALPDGDYSRGAPATSTAPPSRKRGRSEEPTSAAL